MSIHALTERAMVMTLSISRWQGHRLDKEASRKVTSEAGAAADAARVNKHLVPKEALAPIVTGIILDVTGQFTNVFILGGACCLWAPVSTASLCVNRFVNNGLIQ